MNLDGMMTVKQIAGELNMSVGKVNNIIQTIGIIPHYIDNSLKKGKRYYDECAIEKIKDEDKKRRQAIWKPQPEYIEIKATVTTDGKNSETQDCLIEEDNNGLILTNALISSLRKDLEDKDKKIQTMSETIRFLIESNTAMTEMYKKLFDSCLWVEE